MKQQNEKSEATLRQLSVLEKRQAPRRLLGAVRTKFIQKLRTIGSQKVEDIDVTTAAFEQVQYREDIASAIREAGWRVVNFSNDDTEAVEGLILRSEAVQLSPAEEVLLDALKETGAQVKLASRRGPFSIIIGTKPSR